eukprot:scaffold11256_cov80-Skeletonema_dohrnii-CCMP3373.AAC.2
MDYEVFVQGRISSMASAHQSNGVVVGEDYDAEEVEFRSLVGDKDGEDVDNSLSRSDKADGDDRRSNGGECFFASTLTLRNDLSALPPPLPNNRVADSLIMQSIGAPSNRAANRNAKYNNCLRSCCIRCCCLVGVV